MVMSRLKYLYLSLQAKMCQSQSLPVLLHVEQEKERAEALEIEMAALLKEINYILHYSS